MSNTAPETTPTETPDPISIKYSALQSALSFHAGRTQDDEVVVETAAKFWEFLTT